jgi:hypothetical protein
LRLPFQPGLVRWPRAKKMHPIKPGSTWLNILLIGVLATLIMHTGLPALAETPEGAAHPPLATYIQVADFVTIFKWLFIAGGLFLTAFATMCITFFGFNIKDARNSMEAKALELTKVLAKAGDIRDAARTESDKLREQ